MRKLFLEFIVSYFQELELNVISSIKSIWGENVHEQVKGRNTNYFTSISYLFYFLYLPIFSILNIVHYI